MNEHQQIKRLLDSLQSELLLHDHWEDIAPSKEALASTAPFAIDTLNCTQWLQWIFIPKMRELLENKRPFPREFSISSYIEEALSAGRGQSEILRISKEMDAFFDRTYKQVKK